MIEVKELTKCYGSTRAVDGISFEVPRGQIVGFLGPNGAGKSTCMKILTSFISPTDGTASVAGYDVVDRALESRAQIGYLPEDTPLYRDMGIVPYLRYIAALRSIPADEVDRRLRDVIATCGLRDMINRDIGTLSKGYRQRVGLAQALLHTPDLLILDEPTEGLDPNQAVEIRRLIREIGADRTVLLSTHHLAEVEAVCDRVIIIHGGKLVYDEILAALYVDRVRVDVARSDGVETDVVAAAFSAVEGVDEVNALDGAEKGTLALEVLARQGVDVREALFAAAVERGFALRELRRAPESLESIFRRVTIEA